MKAETLLANMNEKQPYILYVLYKIPQRHKEHKNFLVFFVSLREN